MHCLLFVEILNEKEFGEAAANSEYDETAINPAMELGLTVDILLMQFNISNMNTNNFKRITLW